MVVTSDYEVLVAHYRELMNIYEARTAEYDAYEYITSMLSPSNGKDSGIQRESILVLMFRIESFPILSSQTEESLRALQIKKDIYSEAMKSLKQYLASGR